MPHKKRTADNVKTVTARKLSAQQRKVLAKRLGMDGNDKRASGALDEIELAANTYKDSNAKRITAKQTHTWLSSTHAQAQRLHASLSVIHPTVKDFLATEGFQGLPSIENTKQLQDALSQYLEASDRCCNLARALATTKKNTAGDPIRKHLIQDLSGIFRCYAAPDHKGKDALKIFVREVMDIFHVSYPAPEESGNKFNRLFSKEFFGNLPRKSKAVPRI